MDLYSNITIGLAFVAGVLSFISPCVLPLIPAYVGYLGARANSQAARSTTGSLNRASHLQRLGLLLHGLCFVAGFSLVFVAFGLLTNVGLRALGGFAADLKTVIAHAGGVLILFFGLHIMGITGRLIARLIGLLDANDEQNGATHEKPELTLRRLLERVQSALYSDTRRQFNGERASGYAGSSLMGIVFAAGWTPCIGPIYGSILTMTANANNGSFGQAAGLLAAYSVGLGLPFLLTAAALDRMQGLLKRLKRQMRMIEVFSGIFLILIGTLVFTDQLSSLAQAGTRFSDFSVNLENCVYQMSRGVISADKFTGCLAQGDNSLPVPDLASNPGTATPFSPGRAK